MQQQTRRKLITGQHSCTQGDFDVTNIVKASPQISEFIDNYPNAKIIVTYHSKTQINELLSEINTTCDTDLELTDYYRIKIEDLIYDASLLAWVRADNQILVCVIKEAGTKPIQNNEDNCPEIDSELEKIYLEINTLYKIRKSLSCNRIIVDGNLTYSGCSAKQIGIIKLKNYVDYLKNEIKLCEQEEKELVGCEEELKNLLNQQNTLLLEIDELQEIYSQQEQEKCNLLSECKISLFGGPGKSRVDGDCSSDQIEFLKKNIDEIKEYKKDLEIEIEQIKHEINDLDQEEVLLNNSNEMNCDSLKSEVQQLKEEFNEIITKQRELINQIDELSNQFNQYPNCPRPESSWVGFFPGSALHDDGTCEYFQHLKDGYEINIPQLEANNVNLEQKRQEVQKLLSQCEKDLQDKLTSDSFLVEPVLVKVVDSLGNIQTNSWAKGTGGGWNSELRTNPMNELYCSNCTVKIGDQITFTVIADPENVEYKFYHNNTGKLIKDWSPSNSCEYTFTNEDYGISTNITIFIRNNNGLEYMGSGHGDDYTYLIYHAGFQ